MLTRSPATAPSPVGPPVAPHACVLCRQPILAADVRGDYYGTVVHDRCELRQRLSDLEKLVERTRVR